MISIFLVRSAVNCWNSSNWFTENDKNQSIKTNLLELRQTGLAGELRIWEN